MGGKPYTAKEIDIMTRMIEDGATYVEVAKAINRPHWAAATKGRKLGLVPKSRWSEEEIAILREGAAKGLDTTQIAEGLEGRTPHAVGDKMRDLGLVRLKEWGIKELNECKQMWRDGVPTYQIVRKTGRSPKAIAERMWRVGVHRPKEWTKQEIKRLRNLWERPELSTSEIADRFPNHNFCSVYGKARDIGLPGRTEIKRQSARSKERVGDLKSIFGVE